ncbi:T9SS type A sorting domain-containing protein [Hymenobacter terricola]|uniref:T9SS type A sorting domain-containing protein n=1 Tax=Hymenobacter terricola TaxID=2819236 RepID=UPI001B313937|nr:T9SS type A sorting domain-containing protein [Hymenobacter terricola]
MKQTLLLALTGLGLLARPAAAQPRPHREPALAVAPAQRITSNTSFRLLTALKQQYRTSAWLDTLRFTYSRFTALSKPLRELRENAPTRGAALRPLRQENYQYNAAGKVTSDSTFTYTSGVLNTTGTLVLASTYNAQGQLAQELQSVRVGGSWRPYGRTTYTYNAQGQNTRILDESYFGSTYLADDQELFTYNAQGQVIVDEFQLADVSGTAFSAFQRDLFTYNAAGLRLTDVQQQYNNGAFADAYRVTNTYTAPIGQPAAAQLAGYLVERAAGTAWQPYAQGAETYDADGNLTTDLYQPYTAGAFANDYRYLYTYQRVLATATAQPLAAGLTVAPNPAPAPGPLALHYHLAAAAPVAVAVLDALGRPVLCLPATPQTAGEHVLSLPQLPVAAGLYAVRLTAGTQSQTVKLVVE